MISFTIPIRTNTGLNAREHWAARAKRVRMEHMKTFAAMPVVIDPPFPLHVHLVRVSPANTPPDDDGVVGGLKGIRDAIAKHLGVDDGARGKIRFTYAAEKGPWSVKVTIESEGKP